MKTILLLLICLIGSVSYGQDKPGSWSSLGAGVNDIVNCIAVVGDNIYVGGNFTTAGGISANRIAKWDGNTWSSLGSGLNNSVNTIAISGNDVYVGGNFTTAGGISANRIAKWDGSKWTSLGTGLNNLVTAISISGNNLFVGGLFTNAGGIAANYIAKWDNSSWSSINNELNYWVFDIQTLDNDLIVGGYFNMAGGNPMKYITKWDGTNWNSYGEGTNTAVTGIAVSGNDIFAGGWFANAGGNVVNKIAKWDGNNWFSLGGGVAGNVSDVNEVELLGTDLYIGGSFTLAGGNSANRIAKWDGTSWSALGDGMDHIVSAFGVTGNKLFAGGYFLTADGIMVNHIAMMTDAERIGVGKSLLSGSGFVNFNNSTNITAGSISINPGFGSGHINLYRYEYAPLNPEGILGNVNEYHWIVQQSSLATPFSGKIKFKISEIPDNKIKDPKGITVYHRFTPGKGSFTPLTTSYISASDEIEADITNFGEFAFGSLATSVTGNTSLPIEYILHQNNPNPFNPSTKINFDIPKQSVVKLVVYDLLGREVSTLINRQLNPGQYSAEWNASGLASGMYFYKLEAGGFTEIRKMILIK